jgi:hypothetical protein
MWSIPEYDAEFFLLLFLLNFLPSKHWSFPISKWILFSFYAYFLNDLTQYCELYIKHIQLPNLYLYPRILPKY